MSFRAFQIVSGQYTRTPGSRPQTPVLDPNPYRGEPMARSIVENGRFDPQLDCFLFSRLPRELRDMIYTYTFALAVPSAASITTPPQEVTPGLIATCRAIYLETYLFPAMLNPLFGHHCTQADRPTRFQYHQTPWNYAALDSLDLSLNQACLENNSIERYATFLSAAERHVGGYVSESPVRKALIKRLDFSEADPLDMLEIPDIRRDVCFSRKQDYVTEWGQITHLPAARQITRLTIRMGREDWHSWRTDPTLASRNCGLALDPDMGGVWERNRLTSQAMLDNAACRRKGVPVKHAQLHNRNLPWGQQISMFPSLTNLEFILESYPQKKRQLDAVVECAKSWVFPMADDCELRFDGNVEESSWREAATNRSTFTAEWLRNEKKRLAINIATVRFKLVKLASCTCQ